jgi:hypothetical protein
MAAFTLMSRRPWRWMTCLQRWTTYLVSALPGILGFFPTQTHYASFVIPSGAKRLIDAGSSPPRPITS